jgi:hypothetical protein
MNCESERAMEGLLRNWALLRPAIRRQALATASDHEGGCAGAHGGRQVIGGRSGGDLEAVSRNYREARPTENEEGRRNGGAENPGGSGMAL